MKNELQIKEENLLEVITEKGDLNILKPLMEEIHLFDTYISDINYIKNKSILNNIKENDGLILKREISKFDDYEIGIYTKDDNKLGIIPEADSPIFARLMDAGKTLKAKLIKITIDKNYIRADIGIYLTEY